MVHGSTMTLNPGILLEPVGKRGSMIPEKIENWTELLVATMVLNKKAKKRQERS